MELSRRGALVGMFAPSATLKALSEPENRTGDLGPTVFSWEEMKPRKTATGEVRSLYKRADGYARSVGNARFYPEPRT